MHYVVKAIGKERGDYAMQTNLLLNNGELYGGKYVALKSFKEKDAISSGDNPLDVYNEAKNKGADDPVVFYVPEKNTIHIY
ncbi:MAG: DUF5678 domain-containing protein [Syntrophales bacterium]|nr:DUF5678 domain-containing protein [Syntrophales bacterium]